MDAVEGSVDCASQHKKKPKRKFWVHPANSARLKIGKFYTCFEEYRSNPDKFFEYFRMTVGSFDELLSLVGPSIARKETNLRRPIPEAERLAVTLRYLSTGMTMRAVSQEYCIGVSTVRAIIKTTCIALWDILVPIHMRGNNSQDDWVQIANKFYERTKFPNVIGVLDGRNVKMNQPQGSIKTTPPLVLLAWVDSEYNFIFIEVGENGEMSEMSVLKQSRMGANLERNMLRIPKPRALPNDESGRCMPFVLIADETFTLSSKVMRPFPKRKMTDCQKMFNYRHGRAHQVVVCTFRILTSKWSILQRPLCADAPLCSAIVKACCVLHNFVRTKDGVYFEDTMYECPLESTIPAGSRGSVKAIDVRNYFASYFFSPQRSVPEQCEDVTSS